MTKKVYKISTNERDMVTHNYHIYIEFVHDSTYLIFINKELCFFQLRCSKVNRSNY